MDAIMNYLELTKDLDPSLIIEPEIEEVEEYSKEELFELLDEYMKSLEN